MIVSAFFNGADELARPQVTQVRNDTGEHQVVIAESRGVRDIAGEHDPASGAFDVEVPDEMAVAYLDAVNTQFRLAEEIPRAVGLSPDSGTLVVVCDQPHSSFVLKPELLPGLLLDWRCCDNCGHPLHAHAEAVS